MSIKWLILDAMGVIFEVADDVSDLLIPFLRSKKNSTPFKIIYKSYIEASSGKITSYKFWNALGYTDEYPEIEKEFLENSYKIDPEFTQIAEKLQDNYKLAMLSNDLKEWSEFLRNKFNINKYFATTVISGEIGYRKPDKRIFEILLKKINSNPEECLFVDDKLENLNSASKLGIKTIRFIRNDIKSKSCTEFEVNNFSELLKVLKNFY
jgi:putative hydrolase of the HAD superfamily